jgi:hypothetical protein
MFFDHMKNNRRAKHRTPSYQFLIINISDGQWPVEEAHLLANLAQNCSIMDHITCIESAKHVSNMRHEKVVIAPAR